MRRRRRDSTTAEIRTDVVRHAARLIAAHGFGAISVAEVAAAAGMTKQALLYHFESREVLRQAVVDHLLEHANRSLITLVAVATGNERDRLGRVLSSIQSFFDAEPWAAAVMLRFVLDGDARVLARIREGVQPWFRFTVDAVQRGQREGRVRKGLDPEASVAQLGILVLTNFALLPVHGWTRSSRVEWQRRRLAELVRALDFYLFPDGKRPTVHARVRRRA